MKAISNDYISIVKFIIRKIRFLVIFLLGKNGKTNMDFYLNNNNKVVLLKFNCVNRKIL